MREFTQVLVLRIQRESCRFSGDMSNITRKQRSFMTLRLVTFICRFQLYCQGYRSINFPAQHSKSYMAMLS